MVAVPQESAMRQIVIFFATAIYTGYAPKAPGTAGSVVGLILAWAAFAPLWRESPAAFLLIFVLIFAVSCWIAGAAEKIFDAHDSPHIVIDEVLGMIATMFMNPTAWPYLAGGFVLFRFFDILKPFPASLIDRRMRGGAGVMLDDLAAGVYANIVLQVLRRLL
ncbi:MAG: phosphatidylglycerophosphatase A family protein [Candidatus Binataceae bacterium]